jgi:hypothetical protein
MLQYKCHFQLGFGTSLDVLTMLDAPSCAPRKDFPGSGPCKSCPPNYENAPLSLNQKEGMNECAFESDERV